MLRPKPSSQPAAASLPDAVGALVGRSVAGLLGQAERSLTGVNALWLGERPLLSGGPSQASVALT